MKHQRCWLVRRLATKQKGNHALSIGPPSLTSFQDDHTGERCQFSTLPPSQTTCRQLAPSFCVTKKAVVDIVTHSQTQQRDEQKLSPPFWEKITAMVVNYSATCCKYLFKGVTNLQGKKNSVSGGSCGNWVRMLLATGIELCKMVIASRENRW